MKTAIKLFMIIGCFTLTHICAASTVFSKQDLVSIDLIIQTDQVSIGGTLVIPSHPEEESLVVLSSGSGPQDRDETLEGFKIFKVIADHLASKGIASFRYDDRGVGESSGDFVNSTLDDLSKDVKAIMAFFTSSDQYPFREFILFGHSQGGIVAAKVAVDNPSVKKVILMGTPSAPLNEVVLYQVRQEYHNSDISKSLIEAEVSAHNKLMWAIRDNKNIDEAYHLFKQTTKSVLFENNAHLGMDPKQMEQRAIAKADEYQIIYALPSLTSFLFYDPSKDLEWLKIPVLGLFGGRDVHVSIDHHKDRMENALLKSGTRFQLLIFENANHFFQKAKTGSINEYVILKKNFVDGFLDAISKWILEFN
jgi:pimeloyl-ACP methyl ester carboxylesterase